MHSAAEALLLIWVGVILTSLFMMWYRRSSMPLPTEPNLLFDENDPHDVASLAGLVDSIVNSGGEKGRRFALMIWQGDQQSVMVSNEQDLRKVLDVLSATEENLMHRGDTMGPAAGNA